LNLPGSLAVVPGGKKRHDFRFTGIVELEYFRTELGKRLFVGAGSAAPALADIKSIVGIRLKTETCGA
jgi:hypothetical protein